VPKPRPANYPESLPAAEFLKIILEHLVVGKDPLLADWASELLGSGEQASSQSAKKSADGRAQPSTAS
jgi:hypothetical protein